MITNPPPTPSFEGIHAQNGLLKTPNVRFARRLDALSGALADRAWPVYEVLGWRWWDPTTGEPDIAEPTPVTRDRLAAAFHHLLTQVGTAAPHVEDGYALGSGGLIVSVEGDGDERDIVASITVDLGAITLDGRLGPAARP